jgi:hypothetical protein
MTTLPALPETYEEAAMSQFASEWIDSCVRGPMNPFSADAARELLAGWLKVIACHNERSAAFVLEMAIEGIEGADEALRELIEEHKVRNEELGHALATYDNILLNRGSPPLHPAHGRPNKNFLADLAIRLLVRDLLLQFPGLHRRRRSRAGKQPSACSIAANALGKAKVRRVDEEAVRKIVEARLGPQKSGVVRFVSHALP